MTRLRVMPPLGCENDMRGRFTLWPFGDSHGTFYLSAGAVASYASAASSIDPWREGGPTALSAADQGSGSQLWPAR